MKHTFTIADSQAQLRLDRLLAERLPDHSRSYYQKLILEGRVHVNERTAKPSLKLSPGDSVTVVIPPPAATDLIPQNIPLDIIFEDNHLLVVNKPAGMVVHPGAGVRDGTLVNAILNHCPDISGVGGRQRPGIVHRLDKATSGLLVVAKDDRSHIHLQRQFADKTAHREYRALVWGHPDPATGRIETLLNRSKSDRKKFTVAEIGKNAVTLYAVEQSFAFLSLVQVWLKTGRTHQIRTHFNHIHHPVFGDPQYSGRQKQLNRLSTLSHKQKALYLLKLIDRQALHAYRLQFTHPVMNQAMDFSVELPDDFQGLLSQLDSDLV